MNPEVDGSNYYNPGQPLGVWLARLIDKQSGLVLSAGAFRSYNSAVAWLATAGGRELPESLIAEVRRFFCTAEQLEHLT